MEIGFTNSLSIQHEFPSIHVRFLSIRLEKDTIPLEKYRGFRILSGLFHIKAKEGENMKIAIGTKNQAKNKAVQNICMSLINQPEFISLDVSSNVSAQPFGDEETLQGAKNRALQACNEASVHMAFGLEGGVKELDGQLYICNWGVLHTKEGQQYIAGGAQLPLPQEVAHAVRNGEELGPVMERYTNQTGIRHNEGAVGIFTCNIVKRADMFEHIVKLLLGQYLKNHPCRK